MTKQYAGNKRKKQIKNRKPNRAPAKYGIKGRGLWSERKSNYIAKKEGW